MSSEKNANLSFYVHDDIHNAANWYNIPLALWHTDDVYILQENRLVFVGDKITAQNWLKRNEGKYCKQIYMGRNKEAK